jgi:hypothetical protein
VSPVLSLQPATEGAERLIAASRHVAEIRHADPGEALITCTCRRLRTAVDVDDRQAVTFVLWQHLHTDADGEDHLLVDDLRTGILYAVAQDAQPEILLILHRTP